MNLREQFRQLSHASKLSLCLYRSLLLFSRGACSDVLCARPDSVSYYIIFIAILARFFSLSLPLSCFFGYNSADKTHIRFSGNCRKLLSREARMPGCFVISRRLLRTARGWELLCCKLLSPN